MEPHRRRGRLAHLHQAEHALLHAGATTRHDADERVAPLGGELEGQRHLLADDAAHAAAHEIEVKHGQNAVAAVDSGGAGYDGFVQARFAPRPLEAVAIGHAVRKDERIDRDERGVAGLERLRISEQVNAFGGGQLEVVSALAAYPIALPGRAVGSLASAAIARAASHGV